MLLVRGGRIQVSLATTASAIASCCPDYEAINALGIPRHEQHVHLQRARRVLEDKPTS